MTASEWLSAVHTAAALHFAGYLPQVEIIRESRVKVRIEVGNDTFVDLFFREETGRIDYSLIVAGKRRYGLDNLGGWHEHPIADPDVHAATADPSPDDALRRLREAADRLTVAP